MSAIYTPPHMRRKGNTSKNGSGAEEKSKAFRVAKQKSERLGHIHQSASFIEKHGYDKSYLDGTARGNLRNSAK